MVCLLFISYTIIYVVEFLENGILRYVRIRQSIYINTLSVATITGKGWRAMGNIFATKWWSAAEACGRAHPLRVAQSMCPPKRSA